MTAPFWIGECIASMRRRQALIATLGSRVLVASVFCVFAFFMVFGTAAQDSSVTPTDAPLLYRKIFVPEESLRSQQTLSTRDDAYYPVEREEFERLLGEARVKHLASEVTLDARITEGSYQARLDERLMMTGTARLSITHIGQGLTTLPLQPLSLAISQPVWVDQQRTDADVQEAEGDVSNSPRGAQVGIDQSGRIVVSVDRSGILQFDWSLRGREDVAGDVVFDLQLPAGTVSFLELGLPKNQMPFAETAVVTRAGSDQGESENLNWRIQLGRESSAELVIGPPNRMREERGLVMLRQASTFEFAVDGTDLVTVLSLDVHHHSLSHLSLELDKGLHLVSARHGATPLTWSETKANSRRRVNLEFPSPLGGVNQEIVLRAVADGVLGKPWRLPRIYAPDVLWLEGKTELKVPESLVVDEILTTDCRQTGVGPLAAPQRGESIQLQEFQPRAITQVIVTPREMIPSARTGTTIALGTAATNLTYVAEIASNGSPSFLLEIDGPTDWHIDRLETQPPDLLDTWQALRGQGQRQKIQIRLKNPLAATPSTRILVHAHQNGMRTNQTMAGADLRLGRLNGVEVTRQLIMLAADAPNQLKMVGDTELSRLSVDDLAEEDLDLVRIRPGGVVFVDDGATDSLTLSLSTSPPNFRADIEIDADLRKEHVDREFTILCTPESSSVDRIQVQFTQTLGEQPRWIWLEDTDLTLDARQVDIAEGETDIASRGETWSIVLPEPQDKPFYIRAQGTGAFRDEASIPLVSVLGASPQSGSVTIRSTDAVPIEVIPKDLWPIPAPAPASHEYTTIRGVFRYEPSLEGQLQVLRAESPQNALARVWNCRLDSRLFREGLAIHTASFFIENNGLSQVEVAIPDGVDVLSVHVDDETVQLSSETPFRASLAVSLPAGRRFPVLQVNYSKQSGRLEYVTRVTAPWLYVDLPTFKQEWILWLPPGLVSQPHAPGDDGSDWRRRLFGPLLRSADKERFHPLLSRDYRSLLNVSDRDDGSNDSLRLQPRMESAPSEVSEGCWSASSSADFVDGSSLGWSARRILVDGPGLEAETHPSTTSVYVVQADFMRATTWAIFLAVTGLVGWITYRRAWLGLPLCVTVGIVALIGPMVVSPILASCFLGALVAAVLSLFRPFARPKKSDPPNSDRSEIPIVMIQTASSVIVFLIILWSSASTAAAQNPTESRSEASPEYVYRVLYPIDDDQEPLGPYVYVPRDFLGALQRDKPGDDAAARQWMIHDAAYRVSFEWDVAEQRLAVREVVADWRLTTFRNDARVHLPMTQDEAYLLPDRAKLDGQRASVAWETNGTGLTISVPQMGPAQLTLAFRPRVSSADGLSSFDIGIPRLPNALMRLQLPRDAAGVRCPTAMGSSTLDNQVGERVVRLGPTDRMVVEWSDDPNFDAGPSGVEADQLTWLRIRPGSVVLHAQFAIACLAGEIREAELAVDRGLRMLPPKSDGPIADYHVYDDESRVIHIEFQPPYGQEVAFEADFVVTGVSGVGAVRPPRLELTSDRTNRRWLGISVDPSLQFDAPPIPPDQRIDPSNFAAAWGDDQPPPQLAMSVGDVPSEIVLATRPREAQLKASQHLSVSCGLEKARLDYEAHIEAVEGNCYQYRLHVPANVNVRSISIAENGDELPAQWARRNANEIIVRGTRPIAGAHRLILQAELPIARKTPVELPRIRLAPALPGIYEVNLYRQSQVRLTDIVTTGYLAIEDGALGRHFEGLGRLEAAVSVDADSSESPAVRFKVSPNRPRTRGELLIFLRREEDTWQVETLYELQVQSGLVDALRFEIPSAWTGPLETDFAAQQEIIDIPDQDRRYLVLRPDTPVSATTQFRIWGELSSRPGEQVRAPDIVPLDVREADRYLIAPETIGQKQVTWVTDGLRAMQLPPRFTDRLKPNEEVFLANQPRFQATIKEMKQASGTAEVALADVHLDCRNDGSISGVATFDVLPAGRSSCLLEMPESCELLQASVDGVPALLEQQGPRQWQLRLGAPQLAQQVQIIFRGVLDRDFRQSDCTIPLPAPTLVDLPAQRSLWTVQAPNDAFFTLAPADSRIDAWSQEVVRLARYLSLVESASEVLAEIDPAVARKWCLPWMGRVVASHNTLQSWADQRANLGRQQSEELRTLESRYKAILWGLTEADLVSDTDLQASRACRPADVWTAALARDASVLLRLDMDDRTSVRIECLHRVEERQVGWTIVAVMSVFVAGLLALLPFSAFERWRSWLFGPTLVLVGVIWWNWFTPSSLGLGIALVGIGLWAVCSFFPNSREDSLVSSWQQMVDLLTLSDHRACVSWDPEVPSRDSSCYCLAAAFRKVAEGVRHASQCTQGGVCPHPLDDSARYAGGS